MKILQDYAENLIYTKYEENTLYYVMLLCALEMLHATRASFLLYEKESNILYSKKTICFKGKKQIIENTDNKVKHVIINLRNDYRNMVKKKTELVMINYANDIPNLSLEMDAILGIKPKCLIVFPFYYYNDFIGVVEIAIEKSSFRLKEEEKAFLLVLLNFSSALIFGIRSYKWAIKDSLTESFTKSYFNKELEEIIISEWRAKKHRKRKTFCLCLLDVDDFKQINDQCGHQTGDKVLQEFVSIVSGVLRGDDILGRYGGDEFALLLRNCSIKEASFVVKKIMKKVHNKVFTVDKKKLSFTISIGVAQYGIHGNDMKSLYKTADIALYHSKKIGKNCYTIYSSKLGS
ncbi:GGDEF domain-containing protein [Spirochaetota bacterium]